MELQSGKFPDAIRGRLSVVVTDSLSLRRIAFLLFLNFAAILFPAFTSFSQKSVQQAVWIVGGEGFESGNAMCQTLDGGYAIAGHTDSYGAGNSDVYVVKLSASGSLQWSKTIGGTNHESGNSICQSRDGSYVIAGYTTSFGAGNADVYVVKLDASGNLEWTKTIGGAGSDSGKSIHRTSDGGIVVGGSTKSYGEGYADYFIVKLDTQGNSCEAMQSGGIQGSGGVISSAGSVVTDNKGFVGSGGNAGKGGILNVLCQKK